MTRILFVCSGNICRSPMAEFVFRDLVKRADRERAFELDSAGTTVYAPMSPVHKGTRQKLRAEGVPCPEHFSRQVIREDYDRYDYLVGMERCHTDAMRRICGGDPAGKIIRMLEFTAHPRDIDDPWYTGDFDASYRDIRLGCEALYTHITGNKPPEA